MPITTAVAHQGVSGVPIGNLTEAPSVEGGNAGGQTSKYVGEYSSEQYIHVSRLDSIRYCSNPELYLTEATGHYIPCDLYESPEAYQVRLSRSYSSFEPYYMHLRNLIVGTALRKPIHIPEDASDDWIKFVANIDLDGSSLHSFAKTVFSYAIDGGCAGIFIEYPEVEDGLTLAEEQARGYRPYLVAIKSEDILGWTSEVSSATLGDETIYGRKLTSLRIRDEYREPSLVDEFSEVISPAVRVYDYAVNPEEEEQAAAFGEIAPRRVRYRIFVNKVTDSGSSDEYTLVKTGYLAVTVIPFTPVYGGTKESYMLARPMLLDVARLNLHHWSVSSDLANQIHLTASPKLVISGIQGGATEFENAPDKTLILERPEAKAYWLGAPMDGAETTIKRLKDLENAMERLAAVAMASKQTSQAESGFSKLLDRAQSDSMLAVLVQNLEESLNMALVIASEYMQEEPISVIVSRDFVPIRLHSQQILAYIDLYVKRAISRKLLLEMLEVGDVFDGIADFDIDEEIARVQEDPDLPLIGSSINGKQDSNLTSGSRPSEDAEGGLEFREADTPSTPGG